MGLENALNVNINSEHDLEFIPFEVRLDEWTI